MPTESSSRLERLWTPLADAALTNQVRRFARDVVAPHADEIDRLDLYPQDLVRQAAALGYTAITLPVEFGGAGAPFSSALAVFEEIGCASAAVAVSMISIFQAQMMIRLFASETVQADYLPRFPQGLLAAYALTEAAHGSDIRTLDTKAHRDGGDWVLSGEKHFITSSAGAELFIILAETDIGVSVFAVPRDTPRLTIYEGSNSATFGLRNGPHMNLRLDGVRVPAHHLIGTEGKGVRQAVTVLDYSRTIAAAISLGIARAAFDAAYERATSRIAFGQHVLQFQGIQWYFAEALADIDACRLLVYHAGRALDAHQDIDRYGSEAKLKAAAVATRTAEMAVQVAGAYGTMVNAPYGRFLRDAKTYEIAGGSAEILKNTIGKYLLKL